MRKKVAWGNVNYYYFIEGSEHHLRKSLRGIDFRAKTFFAITADDEKLLFYRLERETNANKNIYSRWMPRIPRYAALPAISRLPLSVGIS